MLPVRRRRPGLGVPSLGDSQLSGLGDSAGTEDYSDEEAGRRLRPLPPPPKQPPTLPPLAPLVAATRSEARGNEEQSLMNRMGGQGEALDAFIDVDVSKDAELAANDVGAMQFDPDLPVEPQVVPTGPGASSSQSPASAGRRVDHADSFKLFGDVTYEARAIANAEFLPLVLQQWATAFLVPLAAVTALLMLLRGLWGQRLGVSAEGSRLPKTAKTLVDRVNTLARALGLDTLLHTGKVMLPDVSAVKSVGWQPFVEYWASPDLAKNIIAVLLQSNARFYHDPLLRVPDGFVCADVYLSAADRVPRLAALARGRDMLAADAARELPGVPLDRIGQIAIGVNPFTDGVQMFRWTQSASVVTFEVGITNLHRDVAESPDFIALGGLFTLPKVLRADKVKAAAGDSNINASPEAVEAAARVESELYEKVVAAPLHKLLTRRNFFVRSSSLGLPDTYPFQYVAVVFYLSRMNADLPEISTLLGIEEGRCPFDGTTGANLATIPPASDGSAFALPPRFKGLEVAGKIRDFFSGAAAAAAAKSWLSQRHFRLLAIPAVLLLLSLTPGVGDFIESISIDVLHCFFNGLLDYFLDAVVVKIGNSHGGTEAGYRALGLFEARLACFWAFNTGYRLYRAFPGGYTKRPICSGNDRFFFVLLFVPAIGLDDMVIPSPDLRSAVLGAIEAAQVLALLLRAEALTPAGRDAMNAAARRFLEALKSPVFLDQQTSAWAIPKFHMLMHVINDGGSYAAPGCTNSSRFEAFLKAFVTRIAKHASGHRTPLRDIVRNYIQRLARAVLEARGGSTANLFSRAAATARQRINAWCSASSTLPLLYRPAQASKGELPCAAVTGDIQQQWARVTGNAEADVHAAQLAWFMCIRLMRPLERFAAVVHIGQTVELDPRSPFLGGAATVDADARRDSPSKALLARIVGAVYVRPLAPGPGAPSDGLPLPAPVPLAGGGAAAAAGTPAQMMPERVFVVVRRFCDEADADAEVIRANGLLFYSTRWPVDRVPGAPLYELLPLAAVLRAVQVTPGRWPGMSAEQMLSYGARTEAGRRAKHLRALAKCSDEKEPILVFWPPTRNTFLPGPVPSQPVGGEEPEAGEEEEEEDGDDMADAARVLDFFDDLD